MALHLLHVLRKKIIIIIMITLWEILVLMLKSLNFISVDLSFSFILRKCSLVYGCLHIKELKYVCCYEC